MCVQSLKIKYILLMTLTKIKNFHGVTRSLLKAFPFTSLRFGPVCKSLGSCITFVFNICPLEMVLKLSTVFFQRLARHLSIGFQIGLYYACISA
jgi:hypothetical protein